jgi:hypothetical protein
MEIAEKEFTFRAHDGGTTLFVWGKNKPFF